MKGHEEGLESVESSRYRLSKKKSKEECKSGS